jgi:hypothetical protein
MLKVTSMVDVDAFIERATEIADQVKRNPSLHTEARQDARILLEQFEEYLEAKGL